MDPQELQQASYELEAKKFEFTREIEREKFKLETTKATWEKIAVFFTPASILVSLLIAVGTVQHSQTMQREAAKAEFELKATEIVLQSDDPEVNWNKACRIQALFGEDRLRGDWAQRLDWRGFAVENDDLKREVARQLIEHPKRASEIISIYGKLFQSDKTVVDFLNRLSPNSVQFKPEQSRGCTISPTSSQ